MNSMQWIGVILLALGLLSLFGITLIPSLVFSAPLSGILVLAGTYLYVKPRHR